MKDGNNANESSMSIKEKPYAMVGAGRLAASIWKTGDERSGWNYRFNVFRMSGTNGRVTQRFSPNDVADLAKLVRVLAFTLADDGCVTADLRDDLFCLAACLDEVFPRTRVAGQCALSPHGPVVKALQQVLDYLWEDEGRDFRGSPTEDHIYRQLVVLKSWLAGDRPCEPTAIGSLKQVDYFGGCPICGKNDGYLNVHRVHWFICHAHRTRWNAGENLFRSWREQTEEDWRLNWEMIAEYQEVEPVQSTDGQPDSPN